MIMIVCVACGSHGSSPSGTQPPDAASLGDGGSGAPVAGCAAALGIDAGFYTCSDEYFVSPTGNDSNSGTSMAAALQTIGAATKLALHAGDCVTVAAGT